MSRRIGLRPCPGPDGNGCWFGVGASPSSADLAGIADRSSARTTRLVNPGSGRAAPVGGW